MPRLIDADALDISKFTRWFDDPNDRKAVERMIRDAPTIDPVHAAGGCYCWECENADPYMCVGTPTDDVNASLFRCYKYDGIYRMRYDFCSRGERREENAETD